jgi:hypothetical protein
MIGGLSVNTPRRRIMSVKRKVLAAAAVGLLTIGGGVAFASAGDDAPEVPDPVDGFAQLPDEVRIVDENGDVVLNPDGTPKMHQTAPPPLIEPTAPDVKYPDAPGEQIFNDVEAPLVAEGG